MIINVDHMEFLEVLNSKILFSEHVIDVCSPTEGYTISIATDPETFALHYLKCMEIDCGLDADQAS